MLFLFKGTNEKSFVKVYDTENKKEVKKGWKMDEIFLF